MQTKFLLSTRTLQLHWKISMNQFAKAQKTGLGSLYLEHFLSLNLTAQNLIFCFEIFKHTHPAIMHKNECQHTKKTLLLLEQTSPAERLRATVWKSSLRRGVRPFCVTGRPGSRKHLFRVHSSLYDGGCKFVQPTMSVQLSCANPPQSGFALTKNKEISIEI